MSSFQRLRFCRAFVFVAWLVLSLSARAQFIYTDAGPYDYNTLANWTGGVANGRFSQELTDHQTITFATDTTLSNGLEFSPMTGNREFTLRSSGAASHTISLLSDIVVSGTSNVVIGSHTTNQELNIDLGMAPRNFSVAAGRYLLVVNTINASTGGSVQKYGGGTMIVAGGLTTMDPNTVWEGTLQIGDGTTNGSLNSGLVVKSGAMVNFNVGSGTNIISSQISDAGAVSKEGNGILKFTAANSYSGGTTINGGTLMVANSTGSATGTGTVTINSGKLQIGDGGTPNGSIAGNVQNMGGELVFKRPGNFTFTPKISGTGTVTIDGGFGSSVTFAGANDNEGWIQVLTGSLYDGASGAYSSAAGMTLGSNASIFVAYDETISRLIDITPATAGTVSIGAGRILTVTTSMTDTFTGTITGSGGFKLAATGSPSAGTQILAGANDYTGGTTIQTGTLKAMNSSGSATGTGTITVNSGAYLQIGDSSSAGAGAVAGSIVNSGMLLIDRPDIFTFASSISGTGEVRFGYGSTRIVTLTGANTYCGTTTVVEGAVADGAPGVFSSATTFALNGSTQLQVNFNETIAGVSAGFSGTGKVTVGANATLTIDTSSAVTFGGVIDGSGSIAKAGTGTLTLSGASGYTGATYLNGGTLVISSDDNLGDPAATLTFGGGTLKFASAAHLYRDVSLGSGGGTLDPQAYEVYLHGVVSGSGGLTKISAGNLWLKGDNTYTGGTTVSAGTLILANSSGSATGTGNVSVAAGATLQVSAVEYPNWGALTGNIANAGTVSFKRADATSYGGVISGTGAVQLNTSTSLALGGSNTYSGDTSVLAGMLQDSAAGAFSPASRVRLSVDGTLKVNYAETIAGLADGTGAGSVTFANGATLTVATPTAETFSFSGLISGAGALIKTGAGQLTLAGLSNTFTGGVAVNGGTLVIAGDASLGDAASALTFGGGTLKLSTTYTSNRSVVLNAGGGTLNTNTYQASLGGTISGTGGLTHQGTGILTLGGTNTYTGGTTVQGGGVIDFTANANLGAAASGVTLNGGYLRTRGAVADFTHPILLTSLGGNINTYGFASTFSGQITGAGALSVQSQVAGGVLTLTNSTNQWAGSTFVESGTLRVGGTNALPTDNTVKVATGATLDIAADQTVRTVTDYATSSAGTINIASGKTLTIAPVASDSFSGTITGSGTLVKQGTATYGLTAANNAFTGRIDVVAGTLTLGGAASFSTALARIASAGTLTVTGTATKLAALDDYATGSSGTLQIDSGLTLSNPSAGTFSGALTGSGSLTFDGAGTLTFAGTSTFTGDVTIQSGTLVVGAVDAFKAGTVTVAAGATFDVAKSTTISGINSAGTAKVASGQTLTLDYPQTLSSVISGAGSVAFNNFNMMITSTITGDQTYTGDTVVNIGTLELGAGGTSGTTGSVAGNIILNHGAVLAFNRATADYTYGGSVSGSGSVSKQGSGTLTLLGASTYDGLTVVKGGTLRLSTPNALPTTTTLGLGAGTRLEVLASQVVAGFAESLNAVIAVNSGQVFGVTLGNATTGTTIESLMQGAGGFAVGSNNGNGQSVTLTADNTFTGGTTIAAGGALRLGNRGPNGMVAGNIVNNGLLVFERSNAVTFSGTISGSGRLQQGAAGASGVVDTLTLTSDNSYTGGTDVWAGRLRVMNTSGSATGSGMVTVRDGAAFLGNGGIAGALVVERGATIGAGLSTTEPAQLKVGNTTFNPGGEFAFVIRDATGVAGTDYGLLSISGTLTVLATSSDPFILSLYSAGGGTAAPATNFDPQQTYSWMMLTTTGGITGFDASAIQIRTGNFQNTLVGGFTVTAAGGNVFLNYSPVPEPSTWSLLLGGLAIAGWMWRRQGRRRAGD
jgi:autotransporter-associated beta strand protein